MTDTKKTNMSFGGLLSLAIAQETVVQNSSVCGGIGGMK